MEPSIFTYFEKPAYMRVLIKDFILNNKYSPNKCRMKLTTKRQALNKTFASLSLQSRVIKNEDNQNIQENSQRVQQQQDQKAFHNSVNIQFEDGKMKENNSNLAFAVYSNSAIYVQCKFQQEGTMILQGYCSFSVDRMYKIKRIHHEIDVPIIDKGKSQDGVIEQIGELTMEMFIIKDRLGVLEMFMIEAKLEKDTELFGEMDPYTKITISGKSYETNVCENAGKNPVWNMKLKIPIESVTEEMKIEVLDKDMTVDDLVGKRNVNLFTQGFLIPTKQLVCHPIYIIEGDKIVGKIEMETRFTLDEI